MQYILASQSPRRKFLLETIIPKFDIIVSNADETIDPDIAPVTAVKILAKRKGEPIAKQYPDAVVISADTIVVINNNILGKPKNEADAERIAGKIAGAGRKAAARIRERSAGSDDWDEERRICLLLILLHLRDVFGGCDTDDGQMRKADSAIQAGD